MQISYYDLLVPVLTKNLKNLRSWLVKGQTHAQKTNVSEVDFLDHRLAPDMFPLLRQVQIATDNAKGMVARLAGIEAIKLEDSETTFDQLISRIDVVLEHLAIYSAEQFLDSAERHILLPYFPNKFQLGKDYLVDYALPNFFFHLNMTYAILRSNGVDLGKADYMGALRFHDGE